MNSLLLTWRPSDMIYNRSDCLGSAFRHMCQDYPYPQLPTCLLPIIL